MIDSHGIFACLLAYLCVFSIAYLLLKKYHLNKASILGLCVLSACGHIAGAVYLYKYTAFMGSDALRYFENASHQFGLGYDFACFVLWLQKSYLIGNSLLGAFLLAGATSFLASIFYLVTFKVLIDKVQKTVLPTASSMGINIIYPSLLLLCWPSYLFWSADTGKDNITFLFTSFFLFAIASHRRTVLNLSLLLISGLLMFLVRPYLLVVIMAAMLLYLFFDKKNSLKLKIGMFALTIIFGGVCYFYMQDYLRSMTTFMGIKITSIGSYIIYTQLSMQETLTAMSMPTYDPYLVFLFWPYFIIINLFLPLGLGASSLTTWVCSLENAFFLGWVIFIIKKRAHLKLLCEKLPVLRFFLIYFSVGITFLSIVNLNLGLAMREKMMYVPALLIVIFVVYCYQKIGKNDLGKSSFAG